MRPIIRWNLWERRWTMLTWSIGTSAYVALIILVYGSIRDQAQVLSRVTDSLSPTTRALFSDSSNLLSPVGYLSSKLYYLVLPLIFSMLAISLTNSLLSREEQNGTLELLLSRPIARSKLLFAKLLSGLGVLAVVGAVSIVVTAVAAASIDFGIALSRLIEVTLVTLLLSLLFAAIAWMLIGIGKSGKHLASGAAGFIALGSYLITSLESTASWLHIPAKLTPYHYFQPSAILNGTYNWWNAVGLLIATVVLLTIGFIGFQHRDID